MIIVKENTTIYPSSWEYNTCRIINRLASIVIENGGKVKPHCQFYIVNRSILEATEDAEKRLETYKNARELRGNNEKLEEAIKETEEKLSTYKAIDNNPRLVNQSTYISFSINGYYYYFQFDSNPFFETLYQKVPIINGERSRDYYLEAYNDSNIQKDCFLFCACTEEEINNAAEIIYNNLMQCSKSGKIKTGRKRIKVNNTYDNGFHYEYVNNAERFEKIDF